jgi:1-acyl-sn-glycerol-3-phosphate acyltransferase
MTEVAESISPSNGAQASERARAVMRACRLVACVGRLIVEARADATPSALVFAPRAQRTARRILSAHGVEVRTSGRAPESPAILVANHVSYLDPLVVSSVAPCISVAKGETVEWPLIGRGLCALGVLFVRRGDAHSGAIILRRALRALRGGASVLNFPEGTTYDGREIGPFRRGFFGLARLARLPLVPTSIVYDDERVPWFGGAKFMPHYWKLAGARSVVARVSFGEPLSADDFAGADDPATALSVRARAAVAAMAGRARAERA